MRNSFLLVSWEELPQQALQQCRVWLATDTALALQGQDMINFPMKKKNTSRASQEIKKKIGSLGVEWMQQEWSFLLARTENEGSTGKLCAPLDGEVNQS